MEKIIEVIISNKDYENDIVDFLPPNESPLYHAIKRALSENNINIEILRFGTVNVNTNDAQIGKLDRPFGNDDFLRRLNQFLKGVQFEEKRALALFNEPQKFEYPTSIMVQDDAHDTGDSYVKLKRKATKVEGAVGTLKLACLYFLDLAGENIPVALAAI